jgi:hypothetical protein
MTDPETQRPSKESTLFQREYTVRLALRVAKPRELPKVSNFQVKNQCITNPEKVSASDLRTAHCECLDKVHHQLQLVQSNNHNMLLCSARY